jgi:CxxC motif-containing protein
MTEILIEDKIVAEKEIVNLVCIMCPKGCHLSVDIKNGYNVSGNACSRGAEYGKNEVINPMRVVTSTVKILGAFQRRCPVKTDRDIPKALVIKAIEILDKIEMRAPVQRGDIVINNILGSGANFVVTKDMKAEKK